VTKGKVLIITTDKTFVYSVSVEKTQCEFILFLFSYFIKKWFKVCFTRSVQLANLCWLCFKGVFRNTICATEGYKWRASAVTIVFKQIEKKDLYFLQYFKGPIILTTLGYLGLHSLE